ncbi:hypothetical protein EUX98_g2154 [Antrodiella citrinella]|uniref:Fungal STAND N-terminal Goodbye domain-containing protein n=1 Tax=Antrodiella citrinella TaxID=2447956 RepID=A0A4S4MZR0_9APHY|nr:hypothetical protein EUX98_g2154 [Antrodiella citrinella]
MEGPSLAASEESPERSSDHPDASIPALSETLESIALATVDKLQDVPSLAIPLDSLQADLIEQFPAISNLLSDVAKIHPVISLAVVAFKVAFEFYLARRDNDYKITLIYASMKDMMVVLLKTRVVIVWNKSPRIFTVQDKLKKLCQSVSADIGECANTCDAYVKQGRVAKWTKAIKWKTKLSRFLQAFSERQEELIRVITLSTFTVVTSIEERIASFLETYDILSVTEQNCAHEPTLTLETSASMITKDPEELVQEI